MQAKEGEFSKPVIVSGAAGFTGAVLVEVLRKSGIEVYALVRPGAEHNSRLLLNDCGLHLVEIFPDNYHKLPNLIQEECSCFFHLVWTAAKGVEGQLENIRFSLNAVEAAAECGCSRFICTGSQAEYGAVPVNEIIEENRNVDPITAYGAAKVSACYATKVRAKELNIEWIWGRIFSLIGKYEPKGRMLPDLFCALKDGNTIALSSCTQNWDYLDVYDAAEALLALAQKGKPGEIYNIANGEFRQLKEYTEMLKTIMKANENQVIYGNAANPYISLQPSVEKIKKDTGWSPKRRFEDSIEDYRF